MRGGWFSAIALLVLGLAALAWYERGFRPEAMYCALPKPVSNPEWLFQAVGHEGQPVLKLSIEPKAAKGGMILEPRPILNLSVVFAEDAPLKIHESSAQFAMGSSSYLSILPGGRFTMALDLNDLIDAAPSEDAIYCIRLRYDGDSGTAFAKSAKIPYQSLGLIESNELRIRIRKGTISILGGR